MLIVLTAIVFAVIGLALGAGGTRLLLLGGSPYYLVAGLGFLLTAFLLFRRRAAALWVYALVVLGSLAWAVWEVGFDWWQLGPRGGVIILLGLWLLTPWIRRPLGFVSPTGEQYGARAWPLALASLLSIGVALFSMTQNPTTSGAICRARRGNPNLGGNVPPGRMAPIRAHAFRPALFPARPDPPENVSNSRWHGNIRPGREAAGGRQRTTYQVTPLKVKTRSMSAHRTTGRSLLDAASCQEKWKYDSNSHEPGPSAPDLPRCHLWGPIRAAAPAALRRTVYLPTSDARLIALDATNERCCTSFADNGVLHLEQGMKYNPAGYYYSTAPRFAVGDRSSSAVPSTTTIRPWSSRRDPRLQHQHRRPHLELDSGNPDVTTPCLGVKPTPQSPNSWSSSAMTRGSGLVYIPWATRYPTISRMGRSEHVEK